jgi:8-oxo-dGTP pyrophosphatase MutT (NUDIX family)
MASRFQEVKGDYSMAGSRKNDAPGNIRAGQSVIGHRGNVLSDELAERSVPKSVAVFLNRPDGKVLAVSRPDDAFDMNMPGGGIEPGESPLEAAKRELWEETGLLAFNLAEIYNDGTTVAFRATDASGKVRSSEEGLAKWVDLETLMQGKYSPFLRKVLQRISL